VPLVSSKDMSEVKKNLSSSSSPVIQMDKRDPDDSVFAPITFNFRENS